MILKKGIVETEMESELFFMLITYLSRIVPVFAGIALVVIAILIIAKPVRSTKILGVGIVFTAVSKLLSSSYSISLRYISIEQVAGFSVPYNFILMLLSFLSLLCICVFIHKNYGIKLIYLPLLLIDAVGTVIDRVVIVLLSRNLGGGVDTGLWLSLVGIIDGFVISAVISIIIIIVFWKNREKEKVIPNAYLIRTIVFLCGVISTGINAFVYLQRLFDTAASLNTGETLYMIDGIASTGISLVFPVYVLIMVFSASRKSAGQMQETEETEK